MIGKTLGHYRILEKVGEGGMGVVYRAHDEQLDRDVAIKVLPASSFRDATARARLLREARAAAALNHPHICTIHEVGEAEGQAYIAMEFVEGQALSARLADRGLPAEQVLRYGLQLAEALAHAHERGVMHRDLKSANVILTPEGRAKVLDFGLAKRLSGEELAEAATQSQASLTQPGALAGTLPYMAPEQLLARPADARSDVWALGVVLYEMAAGVRPFQGQTGFELSSAILNRPPRPLPAGTPASLQAVIERCLEKEPGRRYQRGGEVRAALEAAQSGVAVMPPAPRPARLTRRRWLALAGTGPVLLAAGYFAWQAWRAPQPAEPLKAVALTTFPGVESFPSLSPDGNYVAFTWTGPKQDNPDIYVQQIGAGSPLRLTTDLRSDYNPAWSPDGRWIAFLRGESSSLKMQAGKRELLLIPPLGGPERKLAEIRVRQSHIIAPYLAWCPEGNCLVVTDFTGEGKPDALFVVSLETGEKRQLTHPQPPVLGDSNPAVSPDGRALVFRRHADAIAGELYWLALERGLTASGEPQRLTLARLDAAYPAWMPDGKEILFCAKESLWRLAVPGESPPARLPYVGEDGIMPVVSRPQPGRPSRLVYVRSFADENIWRIETSGPGAPASSPPEVAISSTRRDFAPQFSPDGRRVAFASSRSGEMEIWLADPDGANAVQLTFMGAPLSAGPWWSPDGQTIAFHSNPKGRMKIHLIPVSGGRARRLTSDLANESHPSFSRDGKWIYFTSDRTGDYRIWKMPASGGEAVQVTPNVGIRAIESPDGAYLYYNDVAFLPGGLWRLPTSGGRPVKMLEGVLQSAFAVVEKGVYYVDQPERGEARLQFLDAGTGKSTTVARSLGPVGFRLAASPDGRTILYSRVDSSVDDLMLVENFK